MNDNRNFLSELNKQGFMRQKLVSAHKSMQENFPFISRIAITLYDPVTHILKSYLHSSDNDASQERFVTHIDNMASLQEIIKKGLPRVIKNQLTFEDVGQEKIMRIGRSGYAASYTMPMFNNGVFFGFIFFNTTDKDAFSENVLQKIEMYGHIISLMVINELSNIKTLIAALKTTGHISHIRDPETGSHLDRMSRYSRLISCSLSDKYNLDDSYIEHIFMFSPLHDIGKIAIPDSILLAKRKLNEVEWNIMRSHVTKGREMIESIITNFGFENIEYVDVLRNIVEFHHEKIDGSGYPSGLKGSEIPFEARVVAVADIFDALSSKRSYKDAWDNDKAFKKLKELTGTHLDKDCVNALIENEEKINYIQEKFNESKY